MQIRNYKPSDYAQVERLYKDSSTFGGQFDVNRDTKERLESLVSQKSSAILVAEENEEIIGTVTIFEDGRSCWLYRFAVKDNDQEVANALNEKAKEIARELGHGQVLVYAPSGNANFEDRYLKAGFTKGGDYTCYWMDI